MSSLERSVTRLSTALEALESRLDERLHDLAASGETAAAARRQAASARSKAREAAGEIDAAIREVRAILATVKGG
jgi:predicted component of type VI protein secretion system